MDPHRTEIRDGMRIEWDVPVPMDDGVVLRADVFRPLDGGPVPAILSYGPYGKGLAFQDGYPTCWEMMTRRHPDTAANSSNLYQSWEVVDPEKWVPDGYAVVRVDSRGAGRSPGFLEHFGRREAKDIYEAVEWAAAQPWCTGKVGMNGISYFAINQWHAASLQPPHLAAICVWEGLCDNYRDADYHGGILNTMIHNWWELQIRHVQHGYGARGHRSRVTGELVAGPQTLTEEQLGANREDYSGGIRAHPFADDWHRDRSADLSRVVVPLLSAGNWGGQGLHLRGNVEGFVRAASKQKWLEMHGREHWTEFYTDYGVALQKRFLGHFLKGEDNGWDREPPVKLRIRQVDGSFVDRSESEWPIARTDWTKLYLHPDGLRLTASPPSRPATICYDPMGDGLTFLSDPLAEPTEITGPSAARLRVSSATEDADLFLVLRVFRPDMKEVVFVGAIDPHTPVGQGWLRASHRKLDPGLSTPWRPYHVHDERQPLVPGEAVDLDVEILPTSIAIPAGYRIGLSIRGRDYVYPGGSGGRLSNMKNEFTGCGPFLHDDAKTRPLSIYGGTVTLHTGPDAPAHVLLPVVPPAGGG